MSDTIEEKRKRLDDYISKWIFFFILTNNNYTYIIKFKTLILD